MYSGNAPKVMDRVDFVAAFVLHFPHPIGLSCDRPISEASASMFGADTDIAILLVIFPVLKRAELSVKNNFGVAEIPESELTVEIIRILTKALYESASLLTLRMV